MIDSLNHPSFHQIMSLESMAVGSVPTLNKQKKIVNYSENVAVSHFVKEVETNFRLVF